MLLKIPEHLVPLAILVLGGAVLVISTNWHGFGLDRIITGYKRRAARLRERRRDPRLAVFVFAGTIFFMLMLHISEIWLWGLVLYLGGIVHDLHQAVYFAANTYTTLGMGSMVLPHVWHELSPIISIAGLFTFALTTGEMFNIVGDHRELQAELARQRQPKG